MTENFSKEKSYKIFNQIHPHYDRINRILSFGKDLSWRKKVLQFLPLKKPLKVLDIATGTGDQIAIFLKQKQVEKVTGLDLSFPMLQLAKAKLEKIGERSRWELLQANAENLPFAAEQFDITTISFGIRNLPHPQKALKEMYRVIKPGGRCMILEFSLPSNIWLRKGYHFYLKWILPTVGGFLSKNYASYQYLSQTIPSFPSGTNFLKLLGQAGFTHRYENPLTGGVVTLYVAEKSL